MPTVPWHSATEGLPRSSGKAELEQDCCCSGDGDDDNDDDMDDDEDNDDDGGVGKEELVILMEDIGDDDGEDDEDGEDEGDSDEGDDDDDDVMQALLSSSCWCWYCGGSSDLSWIKGRRLSTGICVFETSIAASVWWFSVVVVACIRNCCEKTIKNCGPPTLPSLRAGTITDMVRAGRSRNGHKSGL